MPLAIPNCPACGGRMLDVRPFRSNPTQPSFVCANKQCTGALYDPPPLKEMPLFDRLPEKRRKSPQEEGR